MHQALDKTDNLFQRNKRSEKEEEDNTVDALKNTKDHMQKQKERKAKPQLKLEQPSISGK